MALTYISSCGESTCFRILSPFENSKENGLQAAVSATEQNLTSKELCEEFILLLEEMTEEAEIQGRISYVVEEKIIIEIKCIFCKQIFQSK